MVRKINKRIIGVDFIKIIASFFVVILHVNGYTMLSHGMAFSSTGTAIAYYSLEGIAYIAVHLFVLAGSYLMCEKEYTSLRSILRIWLTTITIAIVGLLIALVLDVRLNMLAIGQSIFPISLRAYGYVSSYIFLILLSPFINITLRKVTDRQLYYISILLIIINIVFPTIIPFISGWGENYTMLFVTLYFVSAIIHRLNCSLPMNRKILLGGVFLWGIMTFVMVCSPYVIEYLSNHIRFLVGKEEYLYNYHNIVVLTEAIGLFLAVTNVDISIKRKILIKAVPLAARGSLVIYLYHMHPIFKRLYHEWRAIERLYSEVWFVYLFKILVVSIIIYILGLILSIIINRIVNFFTNKIIDRVLCSSRINKILSGCRITIMPNL